MNSNSVDMLCRFHHGGQVHADLLAAATGEQGDPVLVGIELVLGGELGAGQGERSHVGERVADVFGVHATVAVPLLFEGKDDQGFFHPLAHAFHAALAPGPELRANVIDDRDAAGVHFASCPEIEGGGIDEDGAAGLAALSLAHQPAEERVDLRDPGKDLGDADDGELAGVHDGVAASAAHGLATDAEELELGEAAAERVDEGCAVHLARGLTGGDQQVHLAVTASGPPTSMPR